ncbi:hypothetical protein QVD17_41740 [Tagetes erecta]|uniref:Uncharacterized protein n=1 Tax=Tagetes erecta TaxID=13708 RepID=A0AAD8NF28_TARER|nr:hypothetical protein QVD17_41740 [Tagetes erecta]
MMDLTMVAGGGASTDLDGYRANGGGEQKLKESPYGSRSLALFIITQEASTPSQSVLLTQVTSLCERFPTIARLALHKDSKVADYALIQNGNITWQIMLKKPPHSLEEFS